MRAGLAMDKRISRLPRGALLLTFFLLGGSVRVPPAFAAPQKEIMVTLGAVSGAPKSEVLVPLMLAPSPPELQIGDISATIRFENKAASFLRAEKGFLLDGVNAGFEAQIQKDPGDPNQSVLQLEVATKGEPRKALREGLVLTLVFRIAEGVNPGTVVDLNIEKLTAGDLSAPAKPIAPLSGQKGSIEVISPEQVPYVACFFFTH